MNRAGGVAFAFVLLSASPLLAGRPCAPRGAPYVMVDAGPNDREVIEQLRAGLRPRGIFVCAGDQSPAGAPVARIAFRSSTTSRVVISVEVSDAITDKKLSRDVDLSEVPADARSLTLALAADEALRASWAELALSSAAAPRRPVPPEVVTTLRESMVPPAPPVLPRWSVGAAFAAEAYTGGQRQLGIDARAQLWLDSIVFAHAVAGLRSGASISTDHGEIRSRAATVGAGPGLSLTSRRAMLGADALLRVEATRARFDGEASGAARGRSGSLTAVYARVALDAWFAPVHSIRIALELGSGLPLRAANVRDGETTVSGLDGALLGGALSFGGVF